MQIVIDGSRSGLQDWARAQSLEVNQLPALTPEQKKVASQLRISEETYARSVKAGELSSEELKEKARVLGAWLEKTLQVQAPSAEVREIRLATFAGKFQILIHTSHREFVLRIDEDFVDRFLETGSQQSEEQLRRILDRWFSGLIS